MVRINADAAPLNQRFLIATRVASRKATSQCPRRISSRYGIDPVAVGDAGRRVGGTLRRANLTRFKELDCAPRLSQSTVGPVPLYRAAATQGQIAGAVAEPPIPTWPTAHRGDAPEGVWIRSSASHGRHRWTFSRTRPAHFARQALQIATQYGRRLGRKAETSLLETGSGGVLAALVRGGLHFLIGYYPEEIR